MSVAHVMQTLAAFGVGRGRVGVHVQRRYRNRR